MKSPGTTNHGTPLGRTHLPDWYGTPPGRIPVRLDAWVVSLRQVPIPHSRPFAPLQFSAIDHPICGVCLLMRSRLLGCALAVALCVVSQPAVAEVRLPKIFGDNMVLQQ